MQQANRFVELEGNFTNDYLLKKTIDPKAQTITLIYGGKEITAAEISALKKKLERYGLPKASLDVKQGFAYLTKDNNSDNEVNQVNLTLAEKEIAALQNEVVRRTKREQQAEKIYTELKILYPGVLHGLIKPQELKDSPIILHFGRSIFKHKTGYQTAKKRKLKIG